MCYVDEWLSTRFLLDMIWIKVMPQHLAQSALPVKGCIKINTIHRHYAITMSFMWLYAESVYMHTW